MLRNETCRECRHLLRTEPCRGQVAVRCMNQRNGHRCGWIISFEPEEYAGQMPVYRPMWCRKGKRL